MSTLAGTNTAARLERLELARALLDTERVALDKEPVTGDETGINATAALIVTVRDLIDDVAEALTPHLAALPAADQRTLTGGWVLYDDERPATHPRIGQRILIRQHVADGPNAGRYVTQRRGLYEHGWLKWRRPETIDAVTPVPHGYAYTWRTA